MISFYYFMTITVKYNNKIIKKFDKINDVFDENQLDIIELDCHSNQLTELPKEICNLINLRYLSFFNNKITEIPEGIHHLINLIHLCCSYNELTKIPKEIGHLINLKSFYCSSNKLKDLPLEIINCTNLNDFIYYDNEIVMNPIIQRFINRHKNINNHVLYNDGQNIHASSIQQSVKESIINLLNDK